MNPAAARFELDDIVSWDHTWHPYICNDCGRCQPVAVSSHIAKVKLSMSDRIALNRQMLLAMGWYVLIETATHLCPDCYGKRMCEAVLKRDRAARQQLDNAVDYKIAMLMIGGGE